MKKKVIIVVVTLLATILFSIGTTYAATTYLFASNEVSYDNTTSGMTNTNVQTAIDELYTEANRYKTLNTKITNLETKTDILETTKSNNPSAVSVSSGTKTSTASFTLTTGSWIITGTVQFPSNGTGYRRIFLSTDSCSTDKGYITINSVPASPSGNTLITVSAIQVLSSSSDKTYYLCALQNSGSSLSVTGRLQALRVK